MPTAATDGARRPGLGRRTFAALTEPAFRRLAVGASANQAGLLLVLVGVNVLVFRITDSGVALGVVIALRMGPALLLGAVIGLLADSVDRLRLARVNALVNAVVPVVLVPVTFAGTPPLWVLYALIGLSGITNSIDNPVRKALVADVLVRARMTNAVALFGTLLTGAEILALVAAGLLIAGPGVQWCFVVAAVCSLVHVLQWAGIRSVRPAPAVLGAPLGALRDGLAYVARHRIIRGSLVLTCVVGMFGYNIHPVLLPLLSDRKLQAGESGYAWLAASVELGCMLAGLLVATQVRPTLRLGGAATALFGLLNGALVLCGGLPAAVGLAVAVGGMLMLSTVVCQTLLQSGCDPRFRGRVFAFQGVAFTGTALIGGPVTGWVAERFGLGGSFLLAGSSCVVVGLVYLLRPARGRAGPPAPAAQLPGTRGDPGPAAVVPDRPAELAGAQAELTTGMGGQS